MQSLSLVSDVLHRFDHFNDSVIESISIDFQGHVYPRFKIRLTCQDDHAEEPTWRTCLLDFHNVREFRIEQPSNTSHSRISFGIAITIEAGLTYVDFACLGETVRTIDEIRSSDFHIGAEKVEFVVL